ncbi:hypothetical protein HR060_02075 [Catenovulum sp. SM1970]|uniref:hypothetical protein n=1 Tax=Marinifaba aquimaris TaxID=2741323 RepID=UPI001573D2A6|nr:hypothetical protein [Marinifaba aquimaris]NTS75642.1 hypothetical protein [Marinifaba aquimaris]
MKFKYTKLASLVLLASIISSTAFATSQNEAILEQALENAKVENQNLKNNLRLANRKIAELEGLVGTLDSEKNSRVSESSNLKGQTRTFIQNQIDALKTFLVEGGLLDYMGSELIARKSLDDDDVTLVDVGHAMSKSGVLTGIGAYVKQPGSVRVKLLRPIDKKLVVIWQSETIRFTQTGLVKKQFANTVSVDKGDIVAYEFNDNVPIGYTSGTGSTLYSHKDLSLGSLIRQSSLKGSRSKRAYSIGVFGLLN